MATQASLDQIQNLYIAFYGRPADLAGQTYWADELEAANGDLTAIIDAFASSEEYDSQYGDLTNEELVNALYQQILGRDAEQAGLDYYVGELEAGNITEGGIALAILNGATGDDSITMANRKAVADEFTAAVEAGDKEYGADQLAAAKALLAGVTSETDPATVDVDIVVDAFPDAEEPVDPGTPGELFSLTASTDVLTGTENDDTFEGYLSQNPFAGGVSNTLSSADRIDGGEGTDTLDVELVDEFVGATTNTTIDVQPRTSSVENIEIEARELSAGNGTITLDAKNMTDIDRIGSHFSDADLVIENLTTLTEDGSIRLTDDLTVVMQHTDNFNSDSDASDLTVLFDEDYLNTSSTTGGSTLLVRLVNAVTNVTNDNPIFGTDSFTFMVGDTEVLVDLTDIAANAALDYTTAYNQIVNAINAAAADAGFDTITATLQPLSPTVFSLPVTVDGTDYEPGDSAGSYYPILITNTGSEELGQGSFTQGQVNTDTDINSTMRPAPASETELPISINVELEKVGRDGEGGNLTIGGKDWRSTGDTDTDQDQNNGIEIFNISVVGDASKPSNLGQIISTDNALRTVNIVSDDTTLDSFAALTVRGEDNEGGDTTPFGGTLDTLNANGFLGNLQIGQSTTSRAVDIETFTATGGGDVTYWASYGDDESGFESLGNLAFSTTTGAGDDIFNADIDSGAQVTATTGAGSDTVIATIDGQTDSGSTLSKLIVNSVSGDNEVTVSSSTDATHSAEINLGSGADTVKGNNVNIDAETGAGSDTIYAENTGTVATVFHNAGEWTTAADLDAAVAAELAVGTGTTLTASELLYGQSVRVTLLMPHTGTDDVDSFVDGIESAEAIEIQASNGYLTTERDLYVAVAEAINNDAVLSKLASAEVDSNGQLKVTYLIDGVTVAGDDMVEIALTETTLSAQDLTNVTNALKADNKDSSITTAEVADAYADVGAFVDVVEEDAAAPGDALGADSTAGTDNTINAGLGDDVIVLSSDVSVTVNAGAADTFEGSADTVVFDQGGFGNDTIVHFDVSYTDADPAATVAIDMLDFSAWLDGMTSASSSVESQVRVDGTVATIGAMGVNTVTQTTFTALNGATAASLVFDTLTDAQVLATLNEAGGFATAAAPGTLVGTEVHSILMVEDVDNLGFYNVYEVASTAGAATDGFTSVELVGTVDFSETTTLIDGNIV